ncbi:hypothetical protein CRUP_012697 [Coryphaenoides rupestris]|nr:hypothetical protein CRUP_012697 [Coryphaenoides rupestris]
MIVIKEHVRGAYRET